MHIDINVLVRLGGFNSTNEYRGKAERLTRATQYSLSYSQSAEASMPLWTRLLSSPNSCVSMVSHVGLMPDERLPERMLYETYGRLWSERQKPETMGGLCQGRLAIDRSFTHMSEKVPRQGRLEGCHRMFAAMHLICNLESVQRIYDMLA